MNEEAGEFEGMGMEEARDAVVRRLEERGLFVNADDYSHSVGTCYRCGTRSSRCSRCSGSWT